MPEPKRVTCFLINLDRSPERLEQFEREASKAALDYVRIGGIDGADNLPEAFRAEFLAATHLSSGEIGCYASHMQVWARMREEGLEAAVVLEDDVRIRLDFERIATAAIETAPEGWDIIHMSTDFKWPPFPIRTLSPAYDLVRYLRMPANSAAYAISAQGAEKLLAAGGRDIPIDMEFRYAWRRRLELFGIYPAPASQRKDVPSTISPCRPGQSAAETRLRHLRPDLFSQARGRAYVISRLGLRGLGQTIVGPLVAHRPFPPDRANR